MHDLKAELLLVKYQLSIPVIVHAVSKQTHRIGIVDVVEQLQTSCRGQGCSNCAADSFEVPYNIPIQPIEQGQGLLVAGSFGGDGCVAVFDPQMVDFPDVFADGIVVLFPHGIPFIHFHFHQGVGFQFHHVHGLLDGHNLIYHSGVEGIVKIGVVPVDFILGLILGCLIVDVFENIGFGEHTVCGFDDAGIRIDPGIGNGFLDGSGDHQLFGFLSQRPVGADSGLFCSAFLPELFLGFRCRSVSLPLLGKGVHHGA